MSQILQDTLGVCQEKFASRGITLTPPAYSSFFSSTYVAAGHVEVGQVLLNLINNAFDIIENQDEKYISIRVEEHKSTIAFKVIDNGPGAPTTQRSCFCLSTQQKMSVMERV